MTFRVEAGITIKTIHGKVYEVLADVTPKDVYTRHSQYSNTQWLLRDVETGKEGVVSETSIRWFCIDDPSHFFIGDEVTVECLSGRLVSGIVKWQNSVTKQAGVLDKDTEIVEPLYYDRNRFRVTKRKTK